MELGLSLGDATKPNRFLAEKGRSADDKVKKKGPRLCMDLRLSTTAKSQEPERKQKSSEDEDDESSEGTKDGERNYVEAPVQLDLLALAPVPRRTASHLPWSPDNNGSSENGSSGNVGLPAARGFDVNRLAAAGSGGGGAAEEVSSANSAPFHLDFGIYRRNIGSINVGGINKMDLEATANDVAEGERASSRASDEDENGLNTRKKLRLSKEQSAYLEESFKEHSTLNPKQKLALARQLNLRPRQVEVWFQNRRARTKLKQTEVDCEYLKRCCETLTEENRRLHKELQELRALKTSNPFYMQLPATTLTMCPSCERVASSSTTTTATASATTTAITNMKQATTEANTIPIALPFPLSRPRFSYPFSHNPTHPNQPAAS